MKAYPIQKINLSDTATLQSLLEHRRVFNLKHCELNIFETFCESENVILSYDGLVVSSMMRGKKTMSVNEGASFDFLPGETVILPEGVSMNVGFPGASKKRPVQCATLALDWDQVNKNLEFLNEQYPNTETPFEWKLNFEQYHFENNKELAASINRLIHISLEDSTAKDALADLSLKFLLMRLIQTQNLAQINRDQLPDSRMGDVVQYIQKNIGQKITIEELSKEACMSSSAFFQQFKRSYGVAPLEYILQRRIEFAKKIMSDPEVTISNVCYQSGFNSINHFIKIFKRQEGVTPGQYLKRL